MKPLLSEKEWRLRAKAVFCSFCCTCGGGAIYILGTSDTTEGVIFPSLIMTLETVLLTVLLCHSLWLGARGKQSESWATLSYGTWTIIPYTLFFYLVWYIQNQPASSWSWFLVQGAMLAVLAQCGMRAALHGQWGKLALWWLGSAVLTFFLFLQYDGYREYAHIKYIPAFSIAAPATKTTSLSRAS